MTLLHLTESRNVQNEIQEKQRIINEQKAIFKAISIIFYTAIVAACCLILYLLSFVDVPDISDINTRAYPKLPDQSNQATVSKKIIQHDINLQDLALEIERNENYLLKDPYASQGRLISDNSKPLLISPPQVYYKGYFFDATSKTAILEIADSNTQLFVREKHKFYSNTATLIKIKKEEIIWKWQGQLYVTKIG